MMFGDEVSGKFLAKWTTHFKAKVITDCKTVLPNQYVEELLSATDPQIEDNYGQCTFYVILFIPKRFNLVFLFSVFMTNVYYFCYQDGTVICQQFCSCSIFFHQPQKATKKQPRSVPLKQPTIL